MWFRMPFSIKPFKNDSFSPTHTAVDLTFSSRKHLSCTATPEQLRTFLTCKEASEKRTHGHSGASAFQRWSGGALLQEDRRVHEWPSISQHGHTGSPSCQVSWPTAKRQNPSLTLTWTWESTKIVLKCTSSSSEIQEEKEHKEFSLKRFWIQLHHPLVRFLQLRRGSGISADCCIPQCSLLRDSVLLNQKISSKRKERKKEMLDCQFSDGIA